MAGWFIAWPLYKRGGPAPTRPMPTRETPPSGGPWAWPACSATGSQSWPMRVGTRRRTPPGTIRSPFWSSAPSSRPTCAIGRNIRHRHHGHVRLGGPRREPALQPLVAGHRQSRHPALARRLAGPAGLVDLHRQRLRDPRLGHPDSVRLVVHPTGPGVLPVALVEVQLALVACQGPSAQPPTALPGSAAAVTTGAGRARQGRSRSWSWARPAAARPEASSSPTSSPPRPSLPPKLPRPLLPTTAACGLECLMPPAAASGLPRPRWEGGRPPTPVAAASGPPGWPRAGEVLAVVIGTCSARVPRPPAKARMRGW